MGIGPGVVVHDYRGHGKGEKLPYSTEFSVGVSTFAGVSAEYLSASRFFFLVLLRAVCPINKANLSMQLISFQYTTFSALSRVFAHF